MNKLNDITNHRFLNILIFLLFYFLFITYNLYLNQIVNSNEYKKKLDNLTVKTTKSTSTPRGRIYDRNYNLLVDNVGVKTIYYKNIYNQSSQSKIKIAYTLAKNINVDYSLLNTNILKDFYYLNNKNKIDKLITKKERNKYKERKITNEKLYQLKLSKITDKMLSSYGDIDKEASYIYYLMNKGYYYDEKVIKEYASEREYAFVGENLNKLKGVNIKLNWERKYLYGDTFKVILGTVSSEKSGVPKELKDDYLKKGYNLNDRVGTSYLEYEYEKYLKGEKEIYKLNKDNTYKVIKKGVRGNDIVLSIDINLQKEIDKILDEEIMNAKNDLNTSLYDGSMVIVSDPNTGEILAMSARNIKDGKIYDNTPSLLTNPVTPGSIVKGASIMTGYKNNAISIGERMSDECVKISGAVSKCSWTYLGYLDDINAIAYSSNSYQFKTAIKVAGKDYYYNVALGDVTDAFNKYRDTFKEFGLGEKTNIDLPVESTGQQGNNDNPGTLLDFSIGQYDTYTSFQILQYINAIAKNGEKYKLHLLKEVRKGTNNDKVGKIIKKNDPVLIGKVNANFEYLSRIKEEFHEVMNAIGSGYMGDVPDPSGKTGTSQSFYDIDKDGNVDVETLSKAFIGYAPSDNPKFSIVILSPNVRYSSVSNYVSPVNYNISKRVSNKVFEILK